MYFNLIGSEEFVPGSGADNLRSGLHRDTSIIAELILESGHKVKASYWDKTPSVEEYYDVNIHLEKVNPLWFNKARSNYLIPNQEWYLDKWIPYLPQFDCVICKTRHAEEIFNSLGCDTHFISFTSPDVASSGTEKDYDSWIHVWGRSISKGTSVIQQTWERNPDFPHLMVTVDPSNVSYKEAKPLPNLSYVVGELPSKWLEVLQNRAGVHLCPSEAEGFGHYINEGLACSSLVITTNGPPMNELVTQERGVLCEAPNNWKARLGRNYCIEPHTLEKSVREVMEMSLEEKKSRAQKGRDFYEENDRFFRDEFRGLVR